MNPVVLCLLIAICPESNLPQQSQKLRVDTQQSVIAWKGTKFRGLGKHEGTLSLKGGQIEVNNKRIVGGSFVIDMSSVEITDMPKHETVPRKRLTDHLYSEDFFYVEKYPESSFVITTIIHKEKESYDVNGQLTMRGQTHPLSFEAIIKGLDSGKISVDAEVSLDRQMWGVSFVGNMTDMLVDDDVYLKVRVVTQ